MVKYVKYLIAAALLVSSVELSAKVNVPHFFSDNMVLQRGKPIVVWGTADKGESVTLSLDGQTRQTKADKSGKWRIELPKMTHGGPYEMTITGRKNTVVLSNILIGDVWLCSGQSNMEFHLSGDLTAKEAVATANYPQIRLLNVPKSIQTRPQADIEKSQWEVCSPKTAEHFSAVGYFFGKRLHENLEVPVGLINSSWGGTDIEPWTSWESSMSNPTYAPFKGKSVEQALGFTMEDVERFKAAMVAEDDIKAKFFSSNGGWGRFDVPKIWDGKLEKEDGIIWFKTEVELPASVEGKVGELNLGSIDDEDISFVNGQEVGRMALWIAGRNYKVAGGILKPGKNVIAVRVKDTGSIGGFLGSADNVWLSVDGKKYPLAGSWEYKPYILTSSFGFQNYGYSPNSFASLLYNGMINPLVGYPMMGVIWYQGENNSGQAYKYRDLFPNMINDWRKKWNDDFAFLWVQLASFMALDKQVPSQSDWAELREAQNMALSLPGTAQAVITDIGEAFDIHPRNKRDVGYRLAHSAMKTAYGKADVVANGPAFEKVEKVGNKMVVSFADCGEGLATADKNRYGYVYGFTVAGADKKFVWAQAYIKDNKVVVFSDEVAEPVAVRYGWCNNPIEINLINSQGLLASPFRSDNWMDPRNDRK